MAIVAATALASILIGVLSCSPALLATLLVSLLLGVLYSTELPFMRWKKSPVLAATCILTVRALVVQLGFYVHMKTALGALPGLTLAVLLPAAPLAVTAVAAGGVPWASVLGTLSSPVLFTTAFMLLFSVVIALFKDIPDVQGDGDAGVRTLSVRLGVGRVFWACILLLTAAYAGALLYLVSHAGGAAGGWTVKTVSALCGHAVMVWLLWARAFKVDLRRKGELVDFYMFIWKLFYAEYLLTPLLV